YQESSWPRYRPAQEAEYKKTEKENLSDEGCCRTASQLDPSSALEGDTVGPRMTLEHPGARGMILECVGA
ncbi:hypothetical protein ACLOJK_039803, partial [Asimina triloba]